MGQDLNYDLLQYHFYNGYAFLHHHLNQDIAPAMVQTYINPYFDVINYLLIELQHPIVTEFLFGAISGIGWFVAYKIAILFFADFPVRQQRIYVIYSLLLSFTGAASISLLNTTTNDTKMSLFVILALWCLIKAMTTTKSSGYIAMSGFLIGMATGLKLTAGCYAISLLMTLFIIVKSDRKNLLLCLLMTICILMGFLIVDGYWMYVIYRQFHNPFFPYFNNVFHSPYAPYSSFNLSPVRETLHFYHYLFFFIFVAIKGNLTAEVTMRDPRLLFTFTLFLLTFIKLCNTHNHQTYQAHVTRNITIIFFVTSYCVWLLSFAVYRYMLPLEWIMGMIIVYLLILLIKTPRMQHIMMCTSIFLLILATHYPDWNNRLAYQNSYLSLQIPKIPENSLILLTTVPLGYTVPFFSATNRFVGMPFIDLGVDDVTNEQIQRRKILVDTMSNVLHELSFRPVYTLSFEQEDRFSSKSIKILNYFGMKQDMPGCEWVTTNIRSKHGKLKLCKVGISHSN